MRKGTARNPAYRVTKRDNHCVVCSRSVAPEDGCYDDAGGHWCLPCWRAEEVREWRRHLERGPRSHTDVRTNALYYDLDAPWENPGDWMRKFGLVGNPWASWMARKGLLDELWDRPVCEADFGDATSRAVAKGLGVRIDSRRQER